MKNLRFNFCMIKSVFFFLLLCILPVKGRTVSLELSATDQSQLHEFIHAMMWSSELGYVLYGNKPICFESFLTDSGDNVGKLYHHQETSISGGVRAWQKLKVPQESEKFIFQINENDSGDSAIFVFINKRAFYKVVNENLAIFRSILGPHMTADKLLNGFRENERSFFSLLNHNKLLIGLLLGFGFENALYVSRQEQIFDAMDTNSRQNFNEDPLSPEMGYPTLEKELETLNQEISISSEALEKYPPELIFGRVIEKNQSKLITDYETNQLHIIHLMDAPNWFEKVLSDFCCEKFVLKISNEVEKTIGFQIPSDIIVAQAIHDTIENDFSDESDSFQTYLKGMRHADVEKDAIYQAPYLRNRDRDEAIEDTFREGFILWSFYKNNKSLFNLESIIGHLQKIQKEGAYNIPKRVLYDCLREIHEQIYTNLKDHEEILAKTQFSNPQGCRMLVENYLYYKQIKAGSGPKIDLQRQVKVAFALKSVHGNVFEEHKEGEWLDLKRTYRGFRESFPQMLIGEKGILYIHPEWGFKNYLAPPHFSPYLIATFEILSQ